MNGNTAVKNQDKIKEWGEVMDLAEKYGFIRYAYGGFAILSVNEEVMK